MYMYYEKNCSEFVNKADDYKMKNVKLFKSVGEAATYIFKKYRDAREQGYDTRTDCVEDEIDEFVQNDYDSFSELLVHQDEPEYRFRMIVEKI